MREPRPRKNRTSAAGIMIEHGEPTQSMLWGICDRCGQPCRYPHNEYNDAVCGRCKTT